MCLDGCGGSDAPTTVVLITLDTTRADYLGCYRALGVVGPRAIDEVVSTPVIDAFASEATVFTNAATPVPITAPAHASMLTGLYPGGHGVFANGTTPLAADVATLTEDLAGRGFACGAFLSAFVLNRQSGLSRGFDTYDDEVVTERSATETTDRALTWLDAQKGDTPIFLWVHYFDPHRPYEERGGADAYAAEISYMDGQLGRLLDGLRAASRHEDALVVIAADHGEGLGDHGEEEHGVFLYDEVVRVPLLVRLPAAMRSSVSTRSHVEASVSLVDVAPTVHEIVGISIGRPLHGYSLVPLIAGTGGRGDGAGHGTDPLAVHLETRYPEMSLGWSRLSGIRTRSWKYIRAPEPELYALADDPFERINGASDRPDTLARFAGQERRIYRRFDLDRDPGAVEDLSNQELERLRSLGYLAPSPTPAETEDLPDPKQMMPLYEHFERGKKFGEEHEWLDAYREFELILAEAPDNFVALFYSAMAAAHIDSVDEAKARYRRILEIDPGNAQASYSLGQILLGEGAIDEADPLLMAATRDNVYAGRAYVLLAQASELRGDLESAHALASRALGEGEVGDRAVRLMALASVRLGAFARAEDELADAVTRIPDDAAIHSARGIVAVRLGRPDPERHFRRATELDPESPSHAFNLACVQAVGGNAEEALRTLTHAVDLGYDDADALATDADLEAVRDLPGYRDLLRRVTEKRRGR